MRHASLSIALGLLLAGPSLASEPRKDASWAELLPVPARLPAAKPEPTEPAPCQPENFIPGETPSQAVTLEGTPAKLYELPTGEQMNINGWVEEGERVVRLPAPFALTYYQFGCAGSFSYVLDISRQGSRHALYQHVLHFDAHPTQPVLFLAQNERKGGGYREFVGLVDLRSKKKTRLPALECVAGTHALFSGERLLTYGEPRAGEDERTAVCVWSLGGRLEARLLADLDWMAASTDVLLDRVGVLPRQPDVFYAIHHERFGEPARCEVRLQSLKRAGSSRRVELGAAASREACLRLAERRLETLRLDGP